MAKALSSGAEAMLNSPNSTAPADPGDVLALLSGPLIHRACLQGSTVSDELIDRVIDSIGTWHPRS
jgi:hypothetical protein